MTLRKRWLALDIGTTGVKAALVDENGKVINSAHRDYATHTAEGGIVEQNAADWWKAVTEAARELNGGSEVEGVALTGQMQDLIVLNADGSPARPVILYSDTRARVEADEIGHIIGKDRLWKLTGNDQNADSLLAKLLWLKRREPAALASARCLLFGAADFIAFKLTGIAIADTTSASSTGLMNLTSRTPLEKTILAQIGLGEYIRLLPALSNGGAQIGKLTASAAHDLSLSAGVTVHHGPGDAGATTLGAGSGTAGSVYGYIGTSGWIAFTSNQPAAANQGVITLAHPQPKTYIQVAPLLTAGGNLEWVRDLFGTKDYTSVIEAALQRPSSNLLYLPYLNGERVPFSDPFARGTFIGLTGRNTEADLYRAVLEGVIYAYRHALDALTTRVSAQTIILAGGGTRSEAWCQLFADILNLPVAIAADAQNVGARGAVLAAQVAAGERTTYNPPDYFPVKITLQPDNQHRAHYDKQYAIFKDSYLALKPIFARMI